MKKKVFAGLPTSLALLRRLANSRKGDPKRRAEAKRLLRIAESQQTKSK